MKLNIPRRFALLIAAFLLFFPIVTLASSDDETITKYPVGHTSKGVVYSTQYNGRFWNTLNGGQKESYISGLMDGVMAYVIASDILTTSYSKKYFDVKDSFFAADFYPAELVKIIDEIYRDNSNIRIPIFEVHRIAVKKANGLNQAKIDELLSGLRKKISK